MSPYLEAEKLFARMTLDPGSSPSTVSKLYHAPFNYESFICNFMQINKSLRQLLSSIALKRKEFEAYS